MRLCFALITIIARNVNCNYLLVFGNKNQKLVKITGIGEKVMEFGETFGKGNMGSKLRIKLQKGTF